MAAPARHSQIVLRGSIRRARHHHLEFWIESIRDALSTDQPGQSSLIQAFEILHAHGAGPLCVGVPLWVLWGTGTDPLRGIAGRSSREDILRLRSYVSGATRPLALFPTGNPRPGLVMQNSRHPAP